MAKTTIYTTSDVREKDVIHCGKYSHPGNKNLIKVITKMAVEYSKLQYRSGESVGFPNKVMARIKNQGGRFLTDNKDGTYSMTVVGKIHKKISNQYRRIKEKVNKSEKKDKIKSKYNTKSMKTEVKTSSKKKSQSTTSSKKRSMSSTTNKSNTPKEKKQKSTDRGM